MNNASLRHQILFVFLLTGILPSLLAAGVIYAWARSEQGKIESLNEERGKEAHLSLISTLQRIQVAAESLAESRDMADLILAPALTRTFLANVLYGRMAVMGNKAREASQWLIRGKDGEPLLSYPESSTLGTILKAKPSPQEVFDLTPDGDVIFSVPLYFDDQGLPRPGSRLLGSLSLMVKKQDLQKSIPTLVQIKNLPPNLAQGGLAIETYVTESEKLPSTPYWLVYLSALAVFAMFGVHRLRKKVLQPLREMTNYLRAKARAPKSDERGTEIQMLRSAFEAYERTIADTQAKLVEESRMSAIGRTTQMLAHDVRKPFTMFKIALDLLAQAKSDPKEFDTILHTLTVETQKAIGNVNRLLQDIMEFGRKVHHTLTPMDPAQLMGSSLSEVFRYREKSDVNFSFSFEANLAVMVDAPQMRRVLANIIENACQAMKDKGEMWFRTRDCRVNGAPHVAMTIGNANSHIPPDNMGQIFEAFFTKGKPQGTGLGLAIAKKIVVEHGGQIKCESSPSMGTEFQILLPAASTIVPAAVPIPTNSKALLWKDPDSHGANGGESQENMSRERLLTCKLLSGLKNDGQRMLRVSVIDDEPIIAENIRMIVSRLPGLSSHITISVNAAKEPDSLDFPEEFPNLIICDLDLGLANGNGLDIVNALRKKGAPSYICVHSNRVHPDDYRQALASGADAFLPKPMTAEHLLTLLIAASKDEAISHGKENDGNPEVQTEMGEPSHGIARRP